MTIRRPGSHPQHPLYHGLTLRQQLKTEWFEADLVIDWTQLTGTPTTIAGYGITDAYTKTQIDAFLALYYTKVQLDAGQLDNRYYTETELNAGQLDTRYFTETESDARFAPIVHNHDSRYYTETELDAGQLDNRYFTETESDARFAALVHNHDSRYYTETELDAGQLDTRYYTEAEVDALIAGVSGSVSSVFGRTGAVVAVAGDYDAFYYTEAEVDTLLAGKANTSHVHAAADVTSGTFADARIAQSNVTQHQAALAIAYTQLTYSGLTATHVLKASGAGAASFAALAASDIASGTFADARIAASNVTQHQASLAIAYTQLTYSGLTTGHVLKATGAGAASFGALLPTQLSGWPANAVGKLTNDGAGTLSWSATGSGTIDGSGTGGKIPKWSDSDTLTDSILSESGSNIIHGQTSFGIFADTADASDNKRIIIGGGGDNSVTRGALVIAYGNEFSVNPGNLHLFAGSTGSIFTRGHFLFDTDATYDIGNTAGPFRPRSAYLSTSLQLGLTASGTGWTFGTTGGAGASPNMQFYTSGTARAVFGVADAANAVCAGTIEGDLVSRLPSGGSFWWTLDGGSTMTMRVTNDNLYFRGQAFELGRIASAAHTFIDFHSEGTDNDYNGRILRASGTNGMFQFEQLGTGGVVFTVQGGNGVTIDQGAQDDDVLQFRSSDVTHGMTSINTTDTYGSFAKYSSTTGGLLVRGLGESFVGIMFRGHTTTNDTTKSTSGQGPFYFSGSLKSGTSVTALGANANIAAFGNNNTTRFILDADGDSHQDVGTAWTNFDTHDDVALLNLMSAHITRQDDPLRESFGQWLVQSRDELERVRLVTFNEDGHHFVNMSRLTMLLTGAVRQLGEKIVRMEAHLVALGAPPLPPLLNP